jgi:tRNA threonylcarbamoyladenosine biosynthesis protein TsaB
VVPPEARGPGGEWSISYRVRVLAVDTTTSRGSLALVEGDAVRLDVRRETAAGHSGWLLVEVERGLRRLSLDFSRLDGLAVAVGPGSFTGLRVGIATVQGLALATGKPVVGLSSLDVLGLEGAGTAPTVVAIMDAFRGEVFSAVFDAGGIRRGARRVGRLEDAVAGLAGPVAFVGDAVDPCRDRIRVQVPGALFPPVDLFLAPALGRAALAALERGEGVPPARLRPLYLRGADIRAPRPKRSSRPKRPPRP